MTEIQWLEMFGNNLVRLLYESKLTQRDLAEMTELSEGTISKYINKTQIPGIKAILSISYALGCTTDELIDFGSTID